MVAYRAFVSFVSFLENKPENIDAGRAPVVYAENIKRAIPWAGSKQEWAGSKLECR